MEEDYFPRGGNEPTTSTTKTKKEKDEENVPYHVQKKRQQKKRSLEEGGGGGVREEEAIENDFLFGNPREKQQRKKKKKNKHHESGGSNKNDDDDDDDDMEAQIAANKHSLLPLGGGGVVLRKKSSALLGSNKKTKAGTEPFIEALGFSRLAKGTKLLGIIREVQDEFALVSLPNLLTGYVLRTECGKNAPPLTQSVSVGQVMAVVILRTITETTASAGAAGGKKSKKDITSTTTRRRIQVSLEPSAINLRHEEPSPKFPIRGKIRGIEDNGLVVDLGHGRKGFLLYHDIDENNFEVKDDGDEDISEDRQEQEDDDDDGKVILRVGSLQDFIVVKKKGGNNQNNNNNDIVPLKLPSPDQMAKYYVPSSDTTTTAVTPTIQTVCPGWLVKVKVEAIAKNGLCVAFMGNVFRGSIELSHLGGYWIPTTRQPDGSTEWKELFDGSTINPIVSFTARILAVDPDTKTIRLTVLPHLMDLRPPPTPATSCTKSNNTSYFLGPGTVLRQCTVIRLDPKVGALLALPRTTKANEDEDDDSNKHDKMDMDYEDDEEEGPDTARSLLHKPLTEKESYIQATKVRAVYVHISKATDEKEDGKTSEALFAKEFAPSTKHDVRILSTSNLIEGVASGAAAESIIKAHVLTHSDLVPGKIFRNVPVCAHLDGGAVLVEFGMEVRGLITVNHLFDKAGTSEYRTKMMKAKYAIGAKVDVRVLSSDPTTRRCFVTAKKSLLQAPDVIDSYTGCKVGSLASGFVSRIDDRCLFVTFFNNVYGRVTARSLALELGIDDHRENYKVGDVVKCRVANIKKFRRDRRRGRGQALYDSDSDDEEEEEEGPGEDERHRYIWELTLSLRVEVTGADLDDEDNTEDTKQKASLRIHLQAGAVLPEKAMKVVNLVPGKEKNNRFVPGYAIVKIKSKYLVDEAESATMLPYVECKLPYDHLQDEYAAEDRESAATLDALASKLLKPGKSVKHKGILLTDPRKSSYEYSAGTGRLTIVSVRPKLVELAEAQSTATDGKRPKLLLPSPDTNIFDGAQVLGFVTHMDNRFGAFVRFLDGLTGLVPKSKGGLDLEPFSTVTARVVSVDHLSSPPKIVLGVPAISKTKTGKASSNINKKEKSLFNAGDVIAKAEIVSLDFYNANVKVLDKELHDHDICARIHCTMAKSNSFQMGKKIKEKYSKFATINKFHPFSGWAVEETLTDLRIVSARTMDGRSYIELTNLKSAEESGNSKDEDSKLPSLVMHESQVPVGAKVTGIVKQIAHFNGGLCLTLGPKFSGFIPGVEVSDNPDVLNNLPSHFPVGARLLCTVIDKAQWSKRKDHATDAHKFRNAAKKDEDHHLVYLSLIGVSSEKYQQATKPVKGELVVGRIQRSMKQVNGPALMLELRGGYVGRCCITEMEEMDEWANMPMGHVSDGIEESKEAAIVSGDSDTDAEESKKRDTSQAGAFPSGMYVSCRVLAGIPSRPLVDVSLRSSRIEGDLEDDELPEAGEMSHAYVVETNKRGCFVRLSRCVEGRVMLKEISDEFLPNPAASFPPGRLVIGKIKEIKQIKSKKQTKTMVDLDMRESTVLQSQQLQFDDVELQSKHKGTVTRVENYGVFVRLEDSKVSGLVHKSECSDKYVKNLFDLYDPGDLVKVLVIKKDEEQRRLGFSMKASHFADDDDSDDDSQAISDEDEDEEMPGVVKADELDSDDEDFGSKLAKSIASGDIEKRNSGGNDDNEKTSASDSDSEDDSESDSDDGDNSDSDDSDAGDRTNNDTKSGIEAMDTDVGFSWDTSDLVKKKASEDESDSDSESDTDDEDAPTSSTSHKSRKKQAQKRREEQEISRRETALADGTADDNPETAADFERLLSGSPNSSEIWIRYMAFHLSLADISSARAVAERAFARIEFSEEREKLNVWSALLQLELKYGSASSLQAAIDRACSQNNPKQVYLRVCEMLEKEVNASSPDTVLQADAMFAKMCKKFKSKKKVWIAHLAYLLKSGRHKEAHELSKRSLKSLPEYKHVETMSKFAQLEFEHGSPERARTVFDGIILKHPKRLDLVFVYADKELKFGSLDMTRALFERIVHPRSDAPKSKLSDKQMRSLFKKWYRIEEEHGTSETQDHVKSSAKAYVERSVSGSK